MQYRPPNANIYSGIVGQCILSLEKMDVDTSWWSYLTDFVGHSIGAVSYFFLLSCLCLLALRSYYMYNYYVDCGLIMVFC